MRRVAPSFTNLQFIGSRLIAMAAMVAAFSTYGFASEGANVRIASFDTRSGETFFAASVQPSANDDLLDAVRSAEADVVVVVDTSASQVGDFRYQSIAALNGVLKRLRSGDRVRIFAGDVQATALGNSFDIATGQSTASAIAQLNKRLPLGNTNLVSVVDTVRAALISQPRDRTRSIVYIGDGASIDATGNNRRFGALVDALRSDRIAVHSIVIGPTTNVQLMAILANQTGGVLGVVGNEPDTNPEVIARTVGGSSVMSPLWLSETKLISGMKAVHGDRMPPLRLDRDSIFLGQVNGAVKQGQFLLTGSTSQSTVRVAVDCKVESSHPDFAFLPGLVKDAAKNGGLTLPTANSSLLREVARVRTMHAEQLVRAGSIALQQGNKEGAKAVAAMALEADPNNQDAISLEKISGNRLVMQNPGDSPFDDIFGGQSAPAPAAGGGAADPFGEATPPDPTAVPDDPFGAPAPAAGGGDDPFGAPAPAAQDSPFGAPDAMEAKPMEAEAAQAAPAAPAIVDTIPRGNAPAFGNNAALGNQFGVQAIPQGVGPVVGDNELLGAGGGNLLRRVEQERTIAEGRLRAEVNAQLRRAKLTLRTNPVNVSKQLKQVLSNVQNTPDINPQLRDDLESQVRTAIQFASRREAEFLEEQVNREEQFEAATAATRLLEETFRREATLDTLSRQMNALIDEGRYEEADGEVSLEFAKIAGDTITRDSVHGRHFTDFPLTLQTYARDRRFRELRERNFVDAFSLVLKAHIPFVDEPPIQYPDSETWGRLSRYRIKKYGAIELVGDNAAERRIQASLDDETTQTFLDTPLEEAIDALKETHDIPIVIDRRALEEIGLTPDTPVNVDLKNVSLRSFMRLMLRELDLTYVIKDEVMQITTQEAAEANLINKVYPVGDLVVPIIQLGGGGQGGGGQGGGGGFGGGGQGGGGGGGLFAVPDDISLRSKAKSKPAAAQQSTKPRTTKAAVNVAAIRVKPKAGQSKMQAWDEFFTNVKIQSAEELTILDQRIRTTVKEFSIKASAAQQQKDSATSIKHFAEARDVLQSAIRAGHVQPWMYQVYAITLKATGAPNAEVERALLSAVDFAEIPEEILHVAARLEDIGSHSAALQLCRRVSEMDENRREPYVMGLRLAERSNDIRGLTWACEGVLSQAWPEKFQPIVEKARLLARATYAQLKEEGRVKEASSFDHALKLAASYDVVIRVSWTGDADVDLSVHEPSGTICSIENLSSAGGGTILGDAFPGHGDDVTGLVSETYHCPKGFSGQYKLLLRRVWGNVTSGNATVEILTDHGRPSQRFIRKQVPLTEKDALLIFEVKDGQRKDEIGQAQLAHLRDVGRDLRNEILGQQAGAQDSSDALRQLFEDTQRLTGGNAAAAAALGFNRPGAVGFRPELTTLPEGASVTGLAIISADRRYVRITPAPVFSQVGDVTTFNFVTGEEGVGGAGGGGIGGAAAGGGGLGGQGFN